MDGKTTVKYLQSYIRQKDYRPELKKDYFLKLTESRYPSPVPFEENR